MATTDRLTGIDTFVQAVDSGSFALAAERAWAHPFGRRKTIARLERRLGARLFQRTTRQQSLTEDGQAYYERLRARWPNSMRPKPRSTVVDASLRTSSRQRAAAVRPPVCRADPDIARECASASTGGNVL